MNLRNGKLLMLASLFTLTANAAPTSLDCKANKIGIEDNLKELASVGRRIASEGCPNPGRMNALCSVISTAAPDIDPNSDYGYLYQRVVYEASCVDYMNDTEEEIASKVQAMWAKYGKNLQCGPMDIKEGHPVKFAASRLFDRFIDEAVNLWRLDLNVIDASDGGTVLDYIEKQIKIRSGATQEKMKMYYKLMRNAGAKHRREL